MRIKVNKTLLAAVCLVAVSSASASVVEDRLIVSYALPVGKVFAQSSQKTLVEQCLTLQSGNSWCVPLPEQRVSAQQRSVSPESLQSKVVKVPAELSITDARAMLESAGFYRHVEHDVIISTGATWNTSEPNDAAFYEQAFYFNDNSLETANASSILSMWRQLKSPEKNVDVYVLDVGFRLAADLDYADGFNFVTMEEGDVRGPGFLEGDFGDGTCPNNHGIGVAGVIGAKINNEIGIAGTTGNVTIHPLRVIRCGAGVMSDASAALDWLAGDSLENLPDFTGEPGVVNMSLGGQYGEGDCPVYLQNSIDKATAKGFTIVVSAGNQSDDSSLYIPAKCANVITVGAANQGIETGSADIASFSNYGESINVMAAGEYIPSLSNNDEVNYWSGTSFAAPLVSGMIASVSKDYDFTPQQWAMLVELSSVSRWVDGSQCDVLGCGKGILDASLLYKNAQRLQNGELDSATYSLNAVPACRHTWMLDNLSKGQSLCDQVAVSLDSFVHLADNETIKLHALAAGQTIAEGLGLVGTFNRYQVLVSKAQLLEKTVFAQRCDANGVCDDPIQVNTTGLAEIPAACQ